MNAPLEVAGFRELISTSWQSHVLPEGWTKEDKQRVDEWARQDVSKGLALRFNQLWPSVKTLAQGKTLVSTAAIAKALHEGSTLTFGGRPYRVKLIDDVLYCAHNIDPTTADAAQKAIWAGLLTIARLNKFTQNAGDQLFVYHEESGQYLIHTPLPPKMLKVLQQELETLAAPPELETEPAQGAIGECWECGARDFYSEADIQERDGVPVYICDVCKEE